MGTTDGTNYPVRHSTKVSDSSAFNDAIRIREDPQDVKEENRGQWGNKVQFLLSCLGCAVGLGNIWRFPAIAYENGASAFLIPYLCCGLIFGLPMIYADFLMAQFTSSGPARVFKRYAPAFQGLGWGMAFNCASVSIYYTVVIAWSVVYLFYTIIGKFDMFVTCGHDWNTIDCVDFAISVKCSNNGTCVPTNISTAARPASQEFFENFLTRRSRSLTDVSEMLWPSCIALILMWALVWLTIVKGIKIMGYMAYITATLPYLVVLMLFGYGLTLDGSMDGINYYLLQPDFSKLLNKQTWSAALNQMMFSLGLGYGTLTTLASYNPRNNNCFRDALIIAIGDTSMSVIGGVAVFSVLGFMAKQANRQIKDVVKSGPELAFVAYPQVVGLMPWPSVVGALFFLMIFLLGISSEVALVEVICTCLYDTFPNWRKKKWLVSLVICTMQLFIGLILVTNAGYHWFTIFSGFAGTIGACVLVILQAVLLVYVYGRTNVIKDIIETIGKPPKCWISRFFSAHSPIFPIMWMTTIPVIGILVSVAIVIEKDPMAYPNGDHYPIWAEIFGWFICVMPVILALAYLIVNIVRVIRARLPWKVLFRPTEDHPSYHRINATREAEPNFLRRILNRLF